MTLAVGAARPRCDTPGPPDYPGPTHVVTGPLPWVTHPFGRVLLVAMAGLRSDTTRCSDAPHDPAARPTGGTPRTETLRASSGAGPDRPHAVDDSASRRALPAAPGRTHPAGPPEPETVTDSGPAGGPVETPRRDAWTASTPPSAPASPSSHPCSLRRRGRPAAAAPEGVRDRVREVLPRSIDANTPVSARGCCRVLCDVGVRHPRPGVWSAASPPPARRRAGPEPETVGPRAAGTPRQRHGAAEETPMRPRAPITPSPTEPAAVTG